MLSHLTPWHVAHLLGLIMIGFAAWGGARS